MLTTVQTSLALARRAVAFTALVVASTALTLASAAPASAEVKWSSSFSSAPTNMVPGERAGIMLWPSNAGDTPSSAFPTVTFELPDGLTLAEAGPPPYWDCLGTTTVTCSLIFPFPVSPYSYSLLSLGLVVNVAADAAPGTYDLPITLDGGDATEPTTRVEQVIIGDEPTEFGIVPGSFEAGTFDENGDPFTQAGGHPYEASTSFTVATKFNDPAEHAGEGSEWLQMVEPVGHVKDVVIDIPAGLVGDATNVPKCRDVEAVASQTCPAGSQVGVIAYDQRVQMGKRMAGIYNMEPDGDLPAQFAFDTPVDQPVTLIPTVRSDGDWGLSVKATELNEGNPIFASTATLWGVPADPGHDAQRCALPNEVSRTCAGVDSLGIPPIGDVGPGSYDPHSSSAPPLPFIANPTRCTGQPETTTIHVDSWSEIASFEPDGDPLLSDSRWKSASTTAPPLDGCESLVFKPTLKLQPTETKPDSPTGLDVEIGIPQNQDADGLASAHLRDTTVLLPEGMRVNPSSAHGLAACSSAQIGLTSKSPVRFSRLEPSCPQEAKIGTVDVDTPLLDEPITGSVYLAAQKDNPFDSLLAMYIVVRGPGILGKIAAHVEPDAATGRLKTTVVENPQVPFDAFRLHIKSGSTAPLTTPQDCGPKTTTADLTSWAGNEAAVSDTFQIDCPGTGTLFDPGFAAGTTNPVAGAFSPLVTRITRATGKELGRVDVKMPKGMLASLRDVPVCSEAQLAAATLAKPGRTSQAASACPAASQIGTTTVGAGSGPDPYFPLIPGTQSSGRVFLTGAHTGTQFPIAGGHQTAYGLGIEVPAVAGPFDLGTVLVRAAIYADPRTAELTVVSDRLPRILQGIPLDVRDVRVAIDRSKFAVNPTSCAEKRISADIRAQDGTLAERSTRFQVGECAALGLKPRISIKLIGSKQTRTGGNPALQARLRQAGGQSNLRNVRVTLPLSLALDARNAGGDWLCSFEGGKRAECPASSRIGTAKAHSPLLKRPVSGPIYFVKNVRIDPKSGAARRTLPTLLFKLSGEVDINIRATSDVVGKRLVSTFSDVPDARVARFDMRIKGGNRRGILAVTGADANICDGKQIASSAVRGQNGKLYHQSISIKTPCPKSSGKKSGKR